MRKLLLGTGVMMGLAGPVWATGVNTIAIDDGSGPTTTLSIIQDTTAVGNTVSGNGSTAGAATTLPIVIFSKASAISRNGIPRPSEFDRHQSDRHEQHAAGRDHQQGDEHDGGGAGQLYQHERQRRQRSFAHHWRNDAAGQPVGDDLRQEQ